MRDRDSGETMTLTGFRKSEETMVLTAVRNPGKYTVPPGTVYFEETANPSGFTFSLHPDM